MKQKILFCLLLLAMPACYSLPAGFINLHDIAPHIVIEMRYAGTYNFVGRRIKGYDAPHCFLTWQAAYALAKIQKKLEAKDLGLKVYDCYRPVTAVLDLYRWSQSRKYQAMKQAFYPHVAKQDLFKLGYIALHSGHSRGSTVDLTIVSYPSPPVFADHPRQPLSCTVSLEKRWHDDSIDMGSGFDCLDPISNVNAQNISAKARHNRLFLRYTMMHDGFEPYRKEWWHFTLQREPYPEHYFDFPVR